MYILIACIRVSSCFSSSVVLFSDFSFSFCMLDGFISQYFQVLAVFFSLQVSWDSPDLFVLYLSLFVSPFEISVNFLLSTDLFLCNLHQPVGRIFFLDFYVLFYLYWFTLSLYLLSFSFFANIFLFIPSYVFRLVCSCLFVVFSFRWVPVYFTFLRCFACSRTFSICPYQPLSHLGFVFLFGFPRGIHI